MSGEPGDGIDAAPGAGEEVRIHVGEEELGDALELRRLVFVEEQGIAAAEEFDGRDGEAVHLVALSRGRVVGTCRLLEGDDGRLLLGRMAVRAAERRRGVAAAMLRVAELHGRSRGARGIVLHAQTYACALYRAAGYRVVGGTFMEAGVEHVKMELELV